MKFVDRRHRDKKLPKSDRGCIYDWDDGRDIICVFCKRDYLTEINVEDHIDCCKIIKPISIFEAFNIK